MISDRIKGLVEIDKQKPRRTIIAEAKGANEQRFMMDNKVNTQNSKFESAKTFEISKMTNRNDKQFIIPDKHTG